jgi:LmbE family N-acetylglucosaminyl deacetylase
MFSRQEAPLRVLSLRTHCDDIAIGCGGTILELCARRTDVKVTEAVFGGQGCRAAEAQHRAELFLAGAAAAEAELDDFRDGFWPVEEEIRRHTVDRLMEVFSKQRRKRWFSRETFEGLMRRRGIECASHTGFAEGFNARKLELTP